MSGPWRTAGAWVLALALVAGAGVLTAIKPGDQAVDVPFPVDAAVGVEGTARNIAVTVHDVRFASRVTGHPSGARMGTDWSADGTWLVIDLDAAAVVDEQSATLQFATLEVGGTTYSASERMTSLLKEQLVPGLPKTGAIAFELPASVHRGPGVLFFGLRPDNRLDSIVQVPVDLSRVGSASSVEIPAPAWSSR